MIVPRDGIVITEDTAFEPGIYFLPRGICIGASDLELEGNGALLVGDWAPFAGDPAASPRSCGIRLKGQSNVTIRNLRIHGYTHGIYAHRCQGLVIQGCQARASGEIPPNTLFLDVWTPVENAYSGDILLWEVRDSLVSDNDLQHQMAGLLTYGCSRLTVRENVADYCSGWGFHLYNTCESLFEANYADFCCRYEPRGERTGHVGADAAGFLIVHNSCRNVFRRNFARLGGDGFFLAGLAPDNRHVGCDDNLFEGNDASCSPNVAFEATFSRGNLYRQNIADRSNYGFWLGFSRDCLLEDNRLIGNRQAGVAVENGFAMQVRGNLLRANRHGVLLWSRRVPEFAAAVPENDTSYNWLIEGNTFSENDKAIRIAADQDHGIRSLAPSGEAGLPAPPPHHHTIRNNTFEQNRVSVELAGAEATIIEENRFLDDETRLIER